ncbi:FecR family protein [Sphingomonas sp. MS122]|uniref:FecR family protein n=1 Tax=Sphingomonas sp. MS122 TaxID=3412683 RepID=UPI003C2DCD60
MSRVASTQERIDAEAADWHAAIECGTADREAFERWRSSDPAHALAFIRLAQVDADLAYLRESGLGERPFADEAPPAQPALGRRKLLTIGGIGAVAAGLGGLGWSIAAAAHTAETAVGERRRIVLAKGLAIELNTDSRVEWRHEDRLYDIRLLRGEVMVERSAGSESCRLHCGRSEIDVAAGARINARYARSGVAVSVLEGGASLRTPGPRGAISLPSLRKATIADGTPPALSALSPVEAGAVTAWQQGQLHFNGENLEEAVAEYNRYLPRPIVIADPAIRQVRLGGRFSATDPTEFCQALREIYGIATRVEPDRIRLTRG